MLSEEEIKTLIELLIKAGKEVDETETYISISDNNDIGQHLEIEKGDNGMKEIYEILALLYSLLGKFEGTEKEKHIQKAIDSMEILGVEVKEGKRDISL